MTMTISEIARALLVERRKLTLGLDQGKLIKAIGPDGLAEALRRRWLVGDENGLRVSQDMAVLEVITSQAEQLQVGDPVTVAEDGKTYTGVVKACAADGKVTVSFGNEKPRTDRPYTKEEVRKATSTTPGRPPTPTTTPTPTASGSHTEVPGVGRVSDSKECKVKRRQESILDSKNDDNFQQARRWWGPMV